jgi:hypothetical protein
MGKRKGRIHTDNANRRLAWEFATSHEERKEQLINAQRRIAEIETDIAAAQLNGMPKQTNFEQDPIGNKIAAMEKYNIFIDRNYQYVEAVDYAYAQIGLMLDPKNPYVAQAIKQYGSLADVKHRMRWCIWMSVQDREYTWSRLGYPFGQRQYKEERGRFADNIAYKLGLAISPDAEEFDPNDFTTADSKD